MFLYSPPLRLRRLNRMVNGGKTEHFWKSLEPLSNNSQKEFIQLRVTPCSYTNGLKSRRYSGDEMKSKQLATFNI